MCHATLIHDNTLPVPLSVNKWTKENLTVVVSYIRMLAFIFYPIHITAKGHVGLTSSY